VVFLFTKSMISAKTDCAELNNSACACAQRSFQSPNGSHLPPLRDGRKTSRSLVRMKSGRMGNSKSSRPDSSSSTERPVFIVQSAPPRCNCPIKSMQAGSNTGSLSCATSVPSKSILKRRILRAMDGDNLEIDLAAATSNGLFAYEIRLRTGDGTAAKRFPRRHLDGRTESRAGGD